MGDSPNRKNMGWYTQVDLGAEDMPVVIQGETYYRTAEVCRMAGISKNTLFRWLKKVIFSDVEYRDWRGWRLFTIAQVEAIKMNSQHITALPLKRKELPVKPSDEQNVPKSGGKVRTFIKKQG
jgi:hypothetical protein